MHEYLSQAILAQAILAQTILAQVGSQVTEVTGDLGVGRGTRLEDPRSVTQRVAFFALLSAHCPSHSSSSLALSCGDEVWPTYASPSSGISAAL